MSEKNSAVNKDRNTLDAAKARLLDYLIHIGHEPDHRGMCHCVWHQPDKHPSMHFDPDKNLVHCFSCGGGGDLVDVVAAVEGLDPKSRTAIDRAIDFAGAAPRGTERKRPSKSRGAADFNAFRAHIKIRQGNFDNTDCINYLTARGFERDDLPTLKSLGLGFDALEQSILIPLGDWQGDGVCSYSARSINPNATERYRNPKGAPVALFNATALNAADVIAVTEGAFDAAAICCLGFNAVGIGGLAHTKKLLSAIKTLTPMPKVIIAFDSDEPARNAAAALASDLAALGVASVDCAPPPGFKDFNDAFRADRHATLAAIQSAVEKLMLITKQPSADDEGEEPEHNKREEPPVIEPPEDASDIAVAKQIVKHANGRLLYNRDLGSYVVYEPPVWITCGKDSELRAVVDEYRVSLDGADNDVEKIIARRLRKSKDVAAVIASLQAFKSLYVRDNAFDAEPMLLNCRNGTLALDSGTLRAHDPADRFTLVADVIFDPCARSELWDRFLASILPDEPTRAFLQTYIGYCLTGSVEEEKALFVHGAGGNGKSTLFNTLLRLFGDFATPFKIDAVLAGGRANAQAATPEFNRLERARLAIAEEIPQGQKLDNAQFKLLTGGDHLPIRMLHKEGKVIAPTHKFIFSGNALPSLVDANDEGLRRRLAVVEFPVVFRDGDADPTLKRRLAEPSVLSAVLNWALDGCRRWQREGLQLPSSVTQQRDKYIADNDFIAAFIEEHCIFEPDCYVKRKELLARARRDGDVRVRAFNDHDLTQAFIAAFDKAGVIYKRARDGRYVFQGVRLVDPNDMLAGADVDNADADA